MGNVICYDDRYDKIYFVCEDITEYLSNQIIIYPKITQQSMAGYICLRVDIFINVIYIILENKGRTISNKSRQWQTSICMDTFIQLSTNFSVYLAGSR